MESSHRGLRRRVAARALEVDVSKSETQGHLSGCGEKSSRTWSSLYLNSRDRSRGPTKHFRLLGEFTSAKRALLDKNLIWFGYIACLSQCGGGAGGYFTSSNDFYLPSLLLEKWGGG